MRPFSVRAMLTLLLSVALPAISVASRQYGEPEAPQMQLLQHKFILEGAEEWHLKEARPLTWIHFPKCGSSFINAITRLPGACPSMADHALNEDTVGGGACWLSHWFRDLHIMKDRLPSAAMSYLPVSSNAPIPKPVHHCTFRTLRKYIGQNSKIAINSKLFQQLQTPVRSSFQML